VVLKHDRINMATYPASLFQGMLLFAGFAAVSFAACAGGGGAAWSNADPERPVLGAESGCVVRVALVVWYWADPISTVLLADVALLGEGGAAWLDAHSLATPTVLATESPWLSGGGAVQMLAHSRCPATVPAARCTAQSSATVLDAEPSALCFGGAAWIVSPPYVADFSCVCFGGAPCLRQSPALMYEWCASSSQRANPVGAVPHPVGHNPTLIVAGAPGG
jgi:hypothetical protein